MPVGIIVFNRPCSSRFIQTLEGNFYMPWPDPTPLPEGTYVSFNEVKLPNSPPGFEYADKIAAIPVPPIPSQGAVAPVSEPKASGGWSKPPASVTSASPTGLKVQNVAVPKITPSVGPATAPITRTPQPLTVRQTKEDYDAIMKKVGSMRWDQNEGFGPSLQITTKLKYEGEGKKLYHAVKNELHDKRIPNQGLYYYVGTMGVNVGKAGFRISAHSKPVEHMNKSKTYTVLHIEN